MRVGAGRDRAGGGQASVANDVDRPASILLPAGGDELGAAAQRRQALGAVGGADEGGETVATYGGVLELLLVGQGGHPGVDQVDHLVGGVYQGVAQAAHHRGVGVVIHRAVARGEAALHLGQHAGGALRAPGQAVGALADRERVVQRGQGTLGLAARGEGPEVVGLVVEHAVDQGEAGPGLPGQLDEGDLLGVARAAVVGGLVLGDQAQLAHLRFEGGGALDPGDPGGEPDHLAHPGSGLGGGEVGADPAAQVSGGADVEHAAGVVLEEVDPRRVGEVIGQGALAALGGADPRGDRLELLEGVHALGSDALHQAVQHVDGGPGVGEGPVVRGGGRVEDLGQGRELAVRGVVAGDHPAGDLGGVDHDEVGPEPALSVVEVAQEADVEGGVVGDQDGAGGEFQEGRQRGLDGRGVGDHGVADAGEDGDEGRDGGVRIDQGLELPEHLAAADLDRTDLGDHAAVLGRPAGGLEVDHTEGHLAQRGAELVEALLRTPP